MSDGGVFVDCISDICVVFFGFTWKYRFLYRVGVVVLLLRDLVFV